MLNSCLLYVVQFGKGLYCTDAAVKAAQYGFTAVDRPEGFLILAVVSLGDEVLELTQPEKVGHVFISEILIYAVDEAATVMLISCVFNEAVKTPSN